VGENTPKQMIAAVRANAVRGFLSGRRLTS
jgi:hypothetical protein